MTKPSKQSQELHGAMGLWEQALLLMVRHTDLPWHGTCIIIIYDPMWDDDGKGSSDFKVDERERGHPTITLKQKFGLSPSPRTKRRGTNRSTDYQNNSSANLDTAQGTKY